MSKKILYYFFINAFFLFQLSSCALLGLDESEDPGYDRGYSSEAYNEEEDCDDGSRECSAPSGRSAGAKHTRNLGSSSETSQDRIKSAIQARDIVLGMTPNDVISSWGVPQQRELAGTGNLGHERWTFGSNISLRETRIVYFENGKVAGWQ